MLTRTLKQQQYQAWLALPPKMRPQGIVTRREFAAHAAVDEATLLEWEHTHGWWNDVFEQARNIVGRALPEVMESMVGRAVAGNVQAMKLCMETLGVRVEELSVKHTYDDDQLMVIVGGGRPSVEAPSVNLLPGDDAN
jgi:hypothetical protein